jgi:hypothetical protein
MSAAAGDIPHGTLELLAKVMASNSSVMEMLDARQAASVIKEPPPLVVIDVDLRYNPGPC